MEENKLERYYCLISSYSYAVTNKMNDVITNKNNNLDNEEEDEDENEPDDVFLLTYENPISISVLMKYLRFIIKQMYLDLGTKEKMEKAIEEIKNGKKISEEKKFQWKDIYLEDLFKADFYYLKKIFVLREDLVPDEKSFINQYSRPEYNITFPFTLKEIFLYFLQKGIDIFIDNFTNYKK